MAELIHERGVPPKWVRKASLWFWLTGALLWFGYQVLEDLRSILIQLVLALFISFAMEPAVNWLHARGFSRGAGTGITMLSVAILILGFLAAMGSLIADQLNQLVTDLPGYVESGQFWLEENLDITVKDEVLLDQIQAEGQASQYASSVANSLLQAGSSILGILFQVLTVALFTFYFTADGPRFRSSICSVLPPTRQHEVLRIWELAISKTGAFLSSRLILAIASAVFHWIVFAVLGLPSAVAMALWVGLISQFVPVIGTYIAGVLPALVALGVDPARALWVIGAVAIYQQIENYLLQPRITAKTLNMHPAIAFGAVLVGAALFGATGAVLALPFVATLQSFLTVYIERHKVVENSLIGDEANTSPSDDSGEDLDGCTPIESGPDKTNSDVE